MTNLEVKISEDKKTATIVIDLTKRAGRSASGKTMVIATTNGNAQIEPGIFLGVNCYTKD